MTKTRFKVISKTELEQGFTILMQVVPANATKIPPNHHAFQVGPVPQDVADSVRVGREYTLDFVEVESASE